MTSSWAENLGSLVRTEQSEAQYAAALAGLVGQLRADAVPVVRVVEALGPWLTGDDDAQRARAIAVVEAVPTAADTPGSVLHLAQFFTSRLTDWPAVRGALRGCLALVSRRDPSGAHAALPAPSDAEAAELVRTCVSHVFIRALAAADRQLALRLLAAAARGYGPALVAANLDLLEYTISSVDGEKDPRCLLLSFEAVRAVLGLYHAQPETSLCHDRLEESAEELFEVLACYFPITFTPPPDDPHRRALAWLPITRGDLASGLEATLAAEPRFAPFVVPLIAEKLSSTLRQAKLDALSLLGACAAGYGPAPLASHVSAIWAALHAELAAPAAEGLLPADLAAADELAEAASTALSRCVAAFQQPSASGEAAGASLADAVLADPSMQDMLACITSPGVDAAMHRRSALQAKAGARAARALCAAGGPAAAKALAQLLPPLLQCVSSPPEAGSASWQAQCLAWPAIADLVEAAAAAPADAAPTGWDGALLQQVVAAAAAGLAAAAEERLAAAAGAMEEDLEEEEEEEEEDSGTAAASKQADRWPLMPSDCHRQQACALQLAALAAAFADARQLAALQRQQVEAAVASALRLLSAAGSSRSQQRAAVAPLSALASSSQAAVLADSALPQLVAAAGRQETAAAALLALQALAAASSSLQLDVVMALDQAIQQQLPAAAQEPGSGSDSSALLLQLLTAATGIVAAAAPAAEAGFVQLGQHLFDAVMLLPPSSTAAVGDEVAAACAELAYHAVLSAPAEQQQALAAPAAEALLEQQAAGLQAAVCCALLVPLRPEAASAATGDQLGALVQRLVRLSLEQQAQAPAARWAALAAAALLNKSTADADELAACASAVLDQQLLPACGLRAAGGSAAPPAAVPAAWQCLAAVTRGLAMRGHKAADAVVSQVISSLNAAAQQWQQGDAGAAGGLAEGVQAAARFLGAVLDVAGGLGGSSAAVGVNKQSHAVARPLWQQRLYTAASGQLLPLLQRSQQAGAADAAPASGSPVLLLALGHLLRAAPGGVQQQEQQRMLPWMLQCLGGLQAGPLADGELLLALLLLASDALMTPAGQCRLGWLGQQQAEADLLPRLVPALLGLARFPPAAAVREAALQCLLLLVELSYTALHPYRRQVARVLAAAVDDDRRAVRLQAARCRQAWGA